jgi:predicted acylesterase/phospholipase RssA
MLKRVLVILALATLPFAAFHAPAFAADPAPQSAEVKQELKKLMEAYGNGEMSAKDYKARKEALLKGKPKA